MSSFSLLSFPSSDVQVSYSLFAILSISLSLRFWPRLTSCVSFLFAYYSAPFRSSSLADQSSSCPCRRHVGSQASCPEVDLLLEVWMSTLASGDPTLHISDSASISSSSSSLSCSTSSSSTSSFSSSSSHAHPSCTATQHPSFSPSPFSPSSSSHSSSSSSSLSFLPAVTSLSRLSIHMFIAVQLPQGNTMMNNQLCV